MAQQKQNQKISRLIGIYNNQTEKLVGEIFIDRVSLDVLKTIFSIREDDPLMYQIYEITEIEFPRLKQYVNFDPDFSLKSYYLECYLVEG